MFNIFIIIFSFHLLIFLQIIGLNPPFGVKGFLANKFINKALTLNPKLLILIVPKVTKRLVFVSFYTLVFFHVTRTKLISLPTMFPDLTKGKVDMI